MTRLRALPGKIRIYRVPAYEPPYDDERPPDWPAPDPWQPTLDFTAARSGCPRPSSGRGVGPVRSAPAAAPVGEETRTVVRRFLTVCVEVLNGYRPAHHLRALSDPLVAMDVIDAGRAAARQLRRQAGPARVRIRRVRMCAPRPDAVEVAAVVMAGPTPDPPSSTGRAWALACRLERRAGQWRCATLRLL